jgi:hypothetical protein
VARYGDDETVLYARRGTYVYPPFTLKQADNVEVAQWVVQTVRTLRRPDEDPRIPGRGKVRVHIDGVGVGAGVVDYLRHHASAEVEVHSVEASRKADDEDNYTLLRDQVWFAARKFIEEGGTIPQDDETKSELIAACYGFDTRNRFKVESKDQMRKVLGRSPDRADAFCLCVYRARQAERGAPPKPLKVAGL